MRVGVVDIGTNSMRLLITDGEIDLQRLEEVTGLGRGVDSTGVLSRASDRGDGRCARALRKFDERGRGGETEGDRNFGLP